MKTIAAILAAGRGTRAGFPVPKQLVDVAGKPLVWYSLKAFQASDVIDAIVLVTSCDCMGKMREIVSRDGFTKVARIVEGGGKRSDSSLAAIRCCGELASGERDADSTKLLIHDAARPLVTGKMIADSVAALDQFEVATIASPASDTIAESDEAGVIENIPDRKKMFVIQTPQSFRLGTLRRAFDLAERDAAFVATDDCGVVKKYLPKVKIAIVPGDEANIKLTYPSDLEIIENILRSRGAV